MPIANRPGDVLADRYLLVDLLSESGNGRFWRAHDRTLDRHVAVHVIAADDTRAEALLKAAKESATVLDRRVLRVLDVDRREDVCYVVNEWGTGTSLDILVAGEGPVPARRAAWIASEVGASVAAAHDAGVAHGRLVPENVLIDQAGSVRVIGLSVEAALIGLPGGRKTSDITDLAGILYFLLTGTWPGVSRSAVPAAPHEHGRVLRPRQVKAGVPRPLDQLCDRVLNPFGANGTGLPDAHEIVEELRDFVGDPTGLAEAGRQERVLPLPQPGDGTQLLAVVPPDPEPEPEPEPESESEPESETEPTPEPGPAPATATDVPTQAGMPIFDDEADEVTWLTARSETPPPPPPFEEPPERPLFAPEPPDGEPVRRARPGANAAPGGAEYWPWESTGTGHGTGSGVIPATPDWDEDDDEVPGRSWLRLAAAIAASLLLLLAVVFAFNLGRGRSPLEGIVPSQDPTSTAPRPSTTTDESAAAEPVADVTASDLDPQADPPEENPELAPLAVDGDPGTGWETSTYAQQLGPGGIKTGVGLVLDLGAAVEITEVSLTLGGEPTGVRLYLSDTEPAGIRGLTQLAELEAGAQETVTPDEPATGRYLVVWLTSLPAVPGGFQGVVSEVEVVGVGG